MQDASFRAQLVARRTYCRPTEGGHESWEDVVARVATHQVWLWERALDRRLLPHEFEEMEDLVHMMAARQVLPSGRILWMGGTEQAKKTEIAMFNCSFTEVRDVYSAVDAYYLLLNGCGVGFKPVSGLLNGFAGRVEVEVVRSNRTDKGSPHNAEWFEGNTWHLRIGDSGLAWAKAFGKLLAMKKPVKKIVLDFSEIRPPGSILAGYGWMSSGDANVAKAFIRVCEIMNEFADRLLDEVAILDIINLVGTTLTSRRSAQIAMLHAHHPLAERFADAKINHHHDAPWRSQSNNSLVFFKRPTKLELRGIFQRMIDAGGSEPGLYNGEAARKRAPWFAGTNPCGEILLPDGGLCNLVEIDIAKFDCVEKFLYAVTLIARANYRQTAVSLKDGVLSAKWHETQEFLRLCGVGLTGLTKWLDRMEPSEAEYWLMAARREAQLAAHDMAQELGTPKAKAVTTVKPSGSLGKLMDTTEGLHRPIGRYVFNNIAFSRHDPVIAELERANYYVFPNPYDDESVLVRVPVDNGPGNWTEIAKGYYIDQESAIVQLDRYKLLMDTYVDHNASVSIYYTPAEVPAIVDWLFDNWDSYVGVSFMPRQDHTKTAEDLGYPYLPQEIVSEADYVAYTMMLLPVNVVGGDMVDDLNGCEGGACPIR